MLSMWSLVHCQVHELSPDDLAAKKSIARLQPIVAERQEKMKDEMLGESHKSVHFCKQLPTKVYTTAVYVLCCM